MSRTPTTPYIVADANSIRGGLYSVESLTKLRSMDAALHFKDGMLAYVQDNQKYYQYNAAKKQWTIYDMVMRDDFNKLAKTVNRIYYKLYEVELELLLSNEGDIEYLTSMQSGIFNISFTGSAKRSGKPIEIKQCVIHMNHDDSQEIIYDKTTCPDGWNYSIMCPSSNLTGYTFTMYVTETVDDDLDMTYSISKGIVFCLPVYYGAIDKADDLSANDIINMKKVITSTPPEVLRVYDIKDGIVDPVTMKKHGQYVWICIPMKNLWDINIDGDGMISSFFLNPYIQVNLSNGEPYACYRSRWDRGLRQAIVTTIHLEYTNKD